MLFTLLLNYNKVFKYYFKIHRFQRMEHNTLFLQNFKYLSLPSSDNDEEIIKIDTQYYSRRIHVIKYLVVLWLFYKIYDFFLFIYLF